MSVIKFLSREKLVEYLDEELRLFLNDREIYEITHYGWLTDNRPDPDYLGLAMWQSDPPAVYHDLTNQRSLTGTRSENPARVDRLLDAGRKFEELMKSARHSIGLCHLYGNNPDGMSPCFGFHFKETSLKLTMAADRMRTFFITVFTDLTGFDPDEIETSSPHRDQAGSSLRPFSLVREILAARPETGGELSGCLAELISLHGRLGGFLNVKNFSGSLKDLDMLASWYQTTVNLADKTFLTEYLFRNLANPPQMERIVEYR